MRRFDPVIVLVGSRHDDELVRLRGRHPNATALLSCEDLSTDGWRVGHTHFATAVIEGQTVAVRDIRGVLVRRSQVFPNELGYVIAADRDYVACEMTAFLRYWLHTLACPIINRASNMSLCGPGWAPLEWIHNAGAQGLDVCTWQRPCESDDNTSTITMVLLDGRWVSDGGDQGIAIYSALGTRLSRFSKSAGMRLLFITFVRRDGTYAIAACSAMPPLDDRLADSILEVLR